MKIHFNMECGAFQSSTQPIDFHDKKKNGIEINIRNLKKWEASKLELETPLKIRMLFHVNKVYLQKDKPQ